MKHTALILCTALALSSCATAEDLASINAKYDRLVASCIQKNKDEGDRHSDTWLRNWCYSESTYARQTELYSANNPMAVFEQFIGAGGTNAAFVTIVP
jgi:hypothetical protein